MYMSTADTALLQQDVSASIDAFADSSGLGELSQHFLQKLQRRSQMSWKGSTNWGPTRAM